VRGALNADLLTGGRDQLGERLAGAGEWKHRGSEITFRGTARIVGGTGAYRGINARKLRAFDHNTLDGQSGTFRLKGFARY
jgi:hypothetical protein